MGGEEHRGKRAVTTSVTGDDSAHVYQRWHRVASRLGHVSAPAQSPAAQSLAVKSVCQFRHGRRKRNPSAPGSLRCASVSEQFSLSFHVFPSFLLTAVFGPSDTSPQFGKRRTNTAGWPAWGHRLASAGVVASTGGGSRGPQKQIPITFYDTALKAYPLSAKQQEN